MRGQSSEPTWLGPLVILLIHVPLTLSDSTPRKGHSHEPFDRVTLHAMDSWRGFDPDVPVGPSPALQPQKCAMQACASSHMALLTSCACCMTGNAQPDAYWPPVYIPPSAASFLDDRLIHAGMNGALLLHRRPGSNRDLVLTPTHASHG